MEQQKQQTEWLSQSEANNLSAYLAKMDNIQSGYPNLARYPISGKIQFQ